MRELCVALAHRWEPERLFVILTAYFDEADTHGPAPTVILACFVGHAYQWERFEKRLVKLRRKFGFTVFHTKHFKSRSGEFSGWSDTRCEELIAALIQLVSRSLIGGISVHLERDRYLNEYRAPPIPRKLHLDSQYGVCFRGCLGALLEILEERGNKDRLNVVMECGHPNVWDCERIFNDLKSRFKRLGLDLLGSWTVETKASCAPLMVADMLAGTHSMMRAALENGASPNSFPRASRDTKGALRIVELQPGALRGLKDGFEELRRLEVAAWRAAKASRKAASGDLSS
jgi:hypothetical protein